MNSLNLKPKKQKESKKENENIINYFKDKILKNKISNSIKKQTIFSSVNSLSKTNRIIKKKNLNNSTIIKSTFSNIGNNTERKQIFNYRDIMLGKKLKDFQVILNLKKKFIRIPNSLKKSFLQRDYDEIESLFKIKKKTKSILNNKIISSKNEDLNTENIVIGLSKLSKSEQSINLLRKNVKMILSSSYSNLLQKQYRENKMNREIKINNLLINEQNSISFKNLDIKIENYPKTKYSNDYILNGNNIIKSFAANSYKSKYSLENNGRILIILDVLKPKNINSWPLNISIFSLFDGYYGNLCSNYLMNNLHKNILKAPFFNKNYQSAFMYGFCETEKNFQKFILEQNIILNKNKIENENKKDINLNEENKKEINNENKEENNLEYENINNSGSCTVNFYLIDDIIYILNLGDCKVLLSQNNITKFNEITIPHNEKNKNENQRILNHGGYFQRGQINYNNLSKDINLPYHELIMPSKLRTTRCFGSFISKSINKDLILSNPDIISFQFNTNFDFIFIGNQEIFRNMSNRDIIDCIKLIFFNKDNKNDIHIKSKNAVDLIIKTAELRVSLGNLSCILIMFKDFV